MGKIIVDSSRWPLVVVRYPPVVSDDDLRQSLESLRKCRERREPYALLVDSTQAKGFSAKHRRMQSEYIASGIDLTRRYLKAFAFVAHSRLQHGILRAIFWLRPPESPHQVFSTEADAEEWILGIMPGVPPRQHTSPDQSRAE